MDREEWEVVPSTNPCCNYSKALPPLFLGPDVIVEADYFRCPTTTSPPHHPQNQHRHHDQEEEEEEPKGGAEDPQADAPAPAEFKDLAISTEFSGSKDLPPFNWLEPDPVVFDLGTDRSHDVARKKELVAEGKDCASFNLWGLSINGIGAICSFGVATAATLCVFALGASSTSSSSSSSYSARLSPSPSPNIQLQIYSHDKRIKEVVQRETGLNHAISAAKEITISRAQISFGGHCEGL